MERQKLVIATVVCSLLFSYGSVASTHVYSQDVSAQSVLMQPGYTGIDFAADTLATIGSPKTNGVAEFARQVSGFQHELGAGLGGDQAGVSIDGRHFPGATPSQRDTTAITVQNSGVTSGESGTLILITLGFVALGLSRRRIKFAAFANANSKPSRTGQNPAINSATAATRDLFTSQFLHAGPNAQASSDTPNDAGVEDTTPEPVKTTASAVDRNPYPELAQSVQKLEALAHEWRICANHL